MKRLGWKPCQRCGIPVEGRLRLDRKAYRYPALCGECYAVYRKGDNSVAWKGGRQRGATGYWYTQDEQGATRLEHRVVWEHAHGSIPEGYDIHHRNGVRADNALENLQLMEHVEHMRLHAGVTALGRWSREHEACVRCHGTERPHIGGGLCRRCYYAAYAARPTEAVPNRARRAVRTALRQGVLRRPDVCEHCNKPQRTIQAAHVDYNQPLLVLWLCPRCHWYFDNA